MAHKSYFFAAGATQKSTLHSLAVIANANRCTAKDIKKGINRFERKTLITENI